ncbi:alcohol dehydrogenase catalytic domain-containing protein [Nonomuraea antimicrobica]|uniref:Alcohol dehydrogenase catalytic domain-containing protein n=1 Tax=Nonomuraea antimicrobica TaxID=561173 RepID=A0ABP7B1R4_9ACTN
MTRAASGAEAGSVMRAAVFRGGRDIRVERLPVPSPGPGDVLVRVDSAGVCGSDVLSYRGLGPWQAGPDRPDGDGHELSGTVAALGPGVTGLAVGHRVAVEPIHLASCGTCERCRAGRTYLCGDRGLIGSVHTHSRGFAEYDLAPAAHVHPLPDGVGLEEAAILDCYACAVHALHLSPPPPGAPVLVIGSGAIGLTLGQVARALGHPVTMLGHRPGSLRLATEQGAADETIDTLSGALPSGGFATVYDAAGNPDTSLAEALDLVAPGGEVVVVGVYATGPRFDPHVAYQREVSVRWSNSYGRCVDGVPDFRRALDLLARGEVRAAGLITHRFALDDIGDAFATHLDRAAGAVKILIKPGAGP